MKSKLFQVFKGKNVNVIMQSVKGSQVLNDGTVVEGNVVMNGFLLDEDDDFFYLGANDEEVDEALKKTDVVRIFIDNENVVEFDEQDSGERH